MPARLRGPASAARLRRFVDAASDLAARGAEVILAEPVRFPAPTSRQPYWGPVRENFGHLFRLAPFTVLVDAAQYASMREPAADSEVAWLYGRQIAEADILAFSKCDLGSPLPGPACAGDETQRAVGPGR